MSEELAKYLCERAQNLLAHSALSGGTYLTLPMRCMIPWGGCGALVKMLGEVRVGGSYSCPVCACGWPYTFWEFKTERDGPGGSGVSRVRTADPNELIFELGPGACLVCGEGGTPPCRCGRVAKAAAEAKLRAEFETKYGRLDQ